MTTHITAKSALRKIDGTFPFDANLNVYQGCDHGCIYCFAQYTEAYSTAESGNFFSNIKVKTNIAELLDRELSKSCWRGKLINLGGVCDSYQNVELECGIMSEVWKVLIKHKSPVVISTKSELILRDMDFIEQLSKVAFVNIASTIITTDEKLALKLEPHASTPSDRFGFLGEIKRSTKASVGVHIMPVIPMLTDSRENFESLFGCATDIKANYTVEFPLHLSGIIRIRFMKFMRKEYPEIFSSFFSLYKDKYVDEDYSAELMKKIRAVKQNYPLKNSYKRPKASSENVENIKQLTLFDF